MGAAAIIGGLLILFAVMSVKNIHDKNIGLLGLPYIVKQALGNTLGNVFLADSALAILVCTLAVCTACIRMLFSMARDGRLPFGNSLARVSGRREGADHPGAVRRRLLAGAAGRQHRQPVGVPDAHLGGDRHVLPAVSGRDRVDAMRSGCTESGRAPSTARTSASVAAGFAINLIAVVYGAVVAFNIAWPRTAVYGTKWYFQFGAYIFIGGSFIIGCLYYFLIQRHKTDAMLAEHRAETPDLPIEHFGDVAP